MTFGEYFKTLRKSKDCTQERIATAIGKSKMLVSGVENGRNDAFVEEDLEIIAELLELSSAEKSNLFFEAAKARCRLPSNIFEYMSKNDDMYRILELVVEENLEPDLLKRIRCYTEDIINAKNN